MGTYSKFKAPSLLLLTRERSSVITWHQQLYRNIGNSNQIINVVNISLYVLMRQDSKLHLLLNYNNKCNFQSCLTRTPPHPVLSSRQYALVLTPLSHTPRPQHMDNTNSSRLQLTTFNSLRKFLIEFLCWFCTFVFSYDGGKQRFFICGRKSDTFCLRVKNRTFFVSSKLITENTNVKPKR